MVRTETTNNRTAGIDTNHSTVFKLLLELNALCEQRLMQFKLQNIPAEFLQLMAKYTLPFSKPVKQKFLMFSEYSHQNKIFLSPMQS